MTCENGTPDTPLTCAEIMARLCHTYNTLMLSGEGAVVSVRLGDETIIFSKDRMTQLKQEIANRHKSCPSSESYAILGLAVPGTTVKSGRPLGVYFG